MAEKLSASELQKLYAAGRKNFRSVDLSAADLKRANLPEVNFQEANLQWVALQAANLRGADLSGADLQKAKLQDANLQKANLQKANLRGANLQWANLQEADLQETELPKIDLLNANLAGANLRWSDLQAANLQKANLSGADMRIATLREANLQDADLQKGKLQKANLQSANLSGANLQQANLQGANLEKAKLVSANLSGANLQQANLQGADLQQAKLYSANLQGANLQGALLPSLEKMQGANLRGANLLGARSPEGENLQAVIQPDGLIPDKRDPSLIQSLTNNDDKIPVIIPEKSYFVKQSLQKSDVEEVGLEKKQEIRETRDRLSALDRLAIAQQRLDAEGERETRETAAERIYQAIASRRGKSAFRQKLLEAYNYRCAVSGCDAEPALEVALILPGAAATSAEISNALPLRADIHTLFDLDMIAIEPKTMTVRVAPSLMGTSYSELNGRSLLLPALAASQPNTSALQARARRCGWL